MDKSANSQSLLADSPLSHAREQRREKRSGGKQSGEEEPLSRLAASPIDFALAGTPRGFVFKREPARRLKFTLQTYDICREITIVAGVANKCEQREILCTKITEAAWPSGLRRWCCNPRGPGFKASALSPPVTSGICFSVVPSSNPRSRFVNSQLVCLLPVGIFYYVTFI